MDRRPLRIVQHELVFPRELDDRVQRFVRHACAPPNADLDHPIGSFGGLRPRRPLQPRIVIFERFECRVAREQIVVETKEVLALFEDVCVPFLVESTDEGACLVLVFDGWGLPRNQVEAHAACLRDRL